MNGCVEALLLMPGPFHALSSSRCLPAFLMHRCASATYVNCIAQYSRALATEDQRQLLTSIQIQEVVDGTWGANGDIWHLADFTRAAGYGHLTP